MIVAGSCSGEGTEARGASSILEGTASVQADAAWETAAFRRGRTTFLLLDVSPPSPALLLGKKHMSGWPRREQTLHGRPPAQTQRCY